MKYIKKFQESSFYEFLPDDEIYQYVPYDDFEELLSESSEEINNSDIKYCLDRVLYFLSRSNGKLCVREGSDINMPEGSPIPSRFIYSVRPVKKYHGDDFGSGLSIEIDCDGCPSDYYITVYKFKDDWWMIDSMLPSEKGSEYFYVVCDSLSGVDKWSKSNFKFSDDQMY